MLYQKEEKSSDSFVFIIGEEVLGPPAFKSALSFERLKTNSVETVYALLIQLAQSASEKNLTTF